LRLEDGGRLKLAPHDPAHRQRWGYPFPFEEGAACPRYESFLKDTYGGDEDAAQKVALLEEFAGAALLGMVTDYERAVVLLGPGGSGKSTIVQIVSGAMPAGSVCAVTPQQMAQEYYRARLPGKRLNIVSELPEARVADAECVKAVISGELMTARKIRGAPFDFRPTAGHLFGANRLPSSSDQTDAYYRRWAVVRHNNICPVGERVPSLAASIVTDELPGIVVRFARGAARLVERGRFALPPSSTATVRDWRHAASSVAVFIDACTRPAGRGAGSLSSDLYGGYCAWARSEGLSPCAANTFGKELKDAGHMAKHTNRGNVYPLVLLGAGSKGGRQ
jgi:putative DNA primase/helicase